MRVLILTVGRYPHLGGKSTHISLLHDGLSKAGDEVRILSASSVRGPWVRLFADLPRLLLQALYTGSGLAWSFRVKGRLLRKELEEALEWADIINIHDAPAWTWLPHPTPTPLILTLHGDMVHEYQSLRQLPDHGPITNMLWQMEQGAYHAAHLILAVDERLRLHAQSTLDTQKIWVVPNGVDWEEWAPDPVARSLVRSRMAARNPVLLVPRRLVPKNGVEVALEAVSLLQKAGLELDLWIAGDGPLRRTLKKQAQSLGLPARFLGGQNPQAMKEYYHGADLVLIPSVPHRGVQEATSLAALEGMASGKVVIASELGGLTQLIRHEVDGLLVRPGDPGDLACGIQRALASPHLGPAARERAKEFSVDSMVEAYRHAFYRVQRS